MSLLIKRTETFAIEAFKQAKDTRKLQQSHIAFTGAPRKHPTDPYRVILVVDPFSHSAFYYEFKIEDIDFVEQLPSLVNMEEDVIPIMRIWVKKQSVGLRCTPFMVADTMMEIKP